MGVDDKTIIFEKENIMLNGKTILITGASRGIGKETSLLLARNRADLILNYNSSEAEVLLLVDEINQMGGRAVSVKANVSDRNEVQAMFKRIRSEFGRLDVLVNNAGIINDDLLLMTKEHVYDNLMDVNVKGCFNCMQFATKMMIGKENGKIINVSSVIGRYGNSGQAVYAATKAAVIGLTTSAAKELGQFGITVNAVAPGVIDTDMTSQLKQEFKDKLIDGTALKRIGKPLEVGKVILFLASDLSDYVSGQIIGVDGCQVV